eukprot:672794-Prorocentrum_minimum.AAC.1
MMALPAALSNQSLHDCASCYTFLAVVPPPKSLNSSALFTPAEDGLLALGITYYGFDWETMQQRLLPAKTTQQ